MAGTWYYGHQNSAIIATTTIVCLSVVAEDSGASWSLPPCRASLPCLCPLFLVLSKVRKSKREWSARQQGGRSTKGILGMGTDVGSDKIDLMLALTLGSSPQQQSSLHPWVTVLAPSILPCQKMQNKGAILGAENSPLQ